MAANSYSIPRKSRVNCLTLDAMCIIIAIVIHIIWRGL